MVNEVPREVPRPKPEGPQAPRVFGRGSSRGTAFTTMHPRLFHRFSFVCHPEPVRRDFFYCRQTQPAPTEYHTQCYVFEVKKLVELNPNKLVWHVERMSIFSTCRTSILAYNSICFTVMIFLIMTCY